MRTKLSRSEVKKGDFDFKDIRNLVKQNPNIIKYCDIVLRNDIEKDPLNDLKVMGPHNESFDTMSLVYFFVVDKIIVKIGDSGTGVEVCMNWYIKKTLDTASGRFIPALYIGDQLRLGKRCEVYIEPLEALRRKRRDIETGEITYIFDGTYHKQRANDYKDYYKKNHIKLLLNSQENGDKNNDLTRKYKQEYKERVLKYEEWRKNK